MAIGATLYVFRIDLADQDRNLYSSHSLKVARHPSETGERMVARVLAWCLHADERLSFGKGLSNPEEADLWLHDDGGDVVHWIEVGEPEPERLKKAARQGRKVSVLGYLRSQSTWWQKQGTAIAQLKGVTVQQVPWEIVQQLAANLPRQVSWQVMISEGMLYITQADGDTIECPVETLLE
ncbi:YaeQ family protein [Alcanivorax sp. 1008]|uniref:YaeQ family protein n=1 Tax=Alcanivorax sp. 1008 TaxID=2816853 RepID=UPI001D8BA15E|nr:YaeQ family protein [Alcanivorax sp. 1008]MCC1495522.1 YaeQ family protein [Alcanivorax sp. 1008]